MHPAYEQLFLQKRALVQQNQALAQENRTLKLQLQEALTEIRDLKDKLNTDSSNSSKPPSQDPFRKKRPKQPTGRKRGAQKGHPGYPRSLIPIEQVQAVHDLRPDICPNCQSSNFNPESVKTEIRQVLELPEISPKVTQFNIQTCRCICCGKHVRAEIPAEAKYGFGPRLMGFVTSLSGEFRLSKRQVVALVGKIGIRICSGSICKIHARASAILAQPFQEIKKHTLNQAHLNADETSWKTLTEKRWMWTGCSLGSVFFEIKTRRTALAFQEVFGNFKGGLTTDRHGAYNSHAGDRQLCWSHVDRDFEKIATRDGFDKLVGEQLLKCKAEVFNLWHSFKVGQITRGELIIHIEKGPKEDLKLWLKAGIAHEDTQSKTKATCGDFFNRFDMLWIFVYRENVEPTNNAAERSLRFGVIWRKLSYGSQSEIGERFVERVMTVAMTLKLRVKNTFEYFTECFRAFIRGGQSPPIFST
jgi:transposase